MPLWVSQNIVSFLVKYNINALLRAKKLFFPLFLCFLAAIWNGWPCYICNSLTFCNNWFLVTLATHVTDAVCIHDTHQSTYQIGEWYISKEHLHCVWNTQVVHYLCNKVLLHQVCYIVTHIHICNILQNVFLYMKRQKTSRLPARKQLCQRGKWIVCVVINCLHT